MRIALPQFFDPDRRILATDKALHAICGFLTFVALHFVAKPFVALGLTAVLGVAFELGQWDAARSIFTGRFPPGHGFGVLDLAADVTGALFAIAILGWALPSAAEAIPQPATADSLWIYDQECSGLTPKPGHGLADVTWEKDSLVEYSLRDRDDGSVTLAVWIPRDQWPDGPGPDTIVLDIWHTAVPRIIAHELLHHLIADTAVQHPDTPFVVPCDLMPERHPA